MRDPCVLAPPGRYFLAVPFPATTVTSTFNGVPFTTPGLRLARGASAKEPVWLLSDAPMSTPFTVFAEDVSAADERRASWLTFSFDRTLGFNGEKVYLTVTAEPTAVPGKMSVIRVGARLGSTDHFWFSIVQQR